MRRPDIQFTGEIPPDVSYPVQRIRDFMIYFDEHYSRLRRRCRQRNMPIDQIIDKIEEEAKMMVCDLRVGHPAQRMSLADREFIFHIITDAEAKQLRKLNAQRF